MTRIEVEVFNKDVWLQRESQSFVLSIDEAPRLVQNLLTAIRNNTVEQQKTFEGELAGVAATR